MLDDQCETVPRLTTDAFDDRHCKIAAPSSALAPSQRLSFSSLQPSYSNLLSSNDDDERRRKLKNLRAALPAERTPAADVEQKRMDPFSPRSRSRMSGSHSSLNGSETTWRSSLEAQVDRRMSWGANSTARSSQTSFESDFFFETPIKTRRPSVASRNASWDGKSQASMRPKTLLRPQPLSSPARLKNQPGEVFKKLPKEVLDVILKELRKLHLWEKGSQTCATCWMRDACSLVLVSRKWAASATPILYESIWLSGDDPVSHIKKTFKLKYGTRLKLLRRSLRKNVALANHVRELKLPDMPEIASTPTEKEAYLDMVASVIMACPNLERLFGLHPLYTQQFTRLNHALSTRTKLTEHVWNMASRPDTRRSQESFKKERRRSRYISMPEKLLARDQQVAPLFNPPPEINSDADFLELHSNWTNLTTLAIHCSPGGTISPSLLQQTIGSLPSLTNLALSSLSLIPVDVLSDLPPLKSLHLSKVSILPQDLASFVVSPVGQSLNSLTLSHIPLDSLEFLTRLFSNLKSLTHFSLIQNHAPCLPANTAVFLHPYLASASLRYMTWDILHPDDGPNDATRILAASISAGGFPDLRSLKAPCDYEGSLQLVCRPMDRIELPSDKYGNSRGAHAPDRKDSGISGIVGIGGFTRLGSPEGEMGESGYTRSLRAARRTAQARIELARLEPKFRVIVEDWTIPAKPRFEARFDVGAYFGTAGCPVVYDLSEDVDGKDSAGMSIEDVLVDGQATSPVVSSATACSCSSAGTCDGRWNEWPRESGEKRKRGWALHRERLRWEPVELGGLFMKKV